MNSSRRPGRILVVDDDDLLREPMAAVLSGLGFEVETARNGSEALLKQRVKPFSLVISDIFMPDCDGFELIQRLRHEFPQTHIIVMSGAGLAETEIWLKTAMSLGAEAILRKPFTTQELSEMIEKFG